MPFTKFRAKGAGQGKRVEICKPMTRLIYRLHPAMPPHYQSVSRQLCVWLLLSCGLIPLPSFANDTNVIVVSTAALASNKASLLDVMDYLHSAETNQHSALVIYSDVVEAVSEPETASDLRKEKLREILTQAKETDSANLAVGYERALAMIDGVTGSHSIILFSDLRVEDADSDSVQMFKQWLSAILIPKAETLAVKTIVISKSPVSDELVSQFSSGTFNTILNPSVTGFKEVLLSQFSDDESSSKQIELAAEQAAAEKAAAEQAAAEIAAAEQAAAEKAAAEQAAAEIAAAEQAAAEIAAAEQAAARKQPPSRLLPRKQPPSRLLPRKQPPSRPLPRKQPPSRPLPRKQPPSRPLPRKQPLSRPLPRKQPPSRPLPRKQPPSRPLPRKQPLSRPLPKKQPLSRPLPKKQPLSRPLPRKQPLSRLLPRKQPLSRLLPRKQPLSRLLPRKQPLSRPLPRKQPLSRLLPRKQPLSRLLPRKQPLSRLLPRKQPLQANLRSPERGFFIVPWRRW